MQEGKGSNRIPVNSRERKEERLFDSEILYKVAIPLSRYRKIELTLIKRTKEDKKEYVLALMEQKQLIYIPGYEEEWGIGKIKYLTLWKNYRGNRGEKD